MERILRTYSRVFILLAMGATGAVSQAATSPHIPKKAIVRVCAAQPATKYISWKLAPMEALEGVDTTLLQLEQLVEQAGRDGCNVLALPEDTLGLLQWEVGNKAAMRQVLPEAVTRMLNRLGKAAAKYNMYLVCASDTVKPDGSYRNTAFLLNRDGREIGRYYAVQPAISESDRVRGTRFPVFKTADLGWVGMLICSDMIFPESARALALAGADIIFDPSLGGAVYSDDSGLQRAAFRTRAVDNFVYLVVAMRGHGAMIISPKGEVLAEGKGPNGIAMAEIDPFSGRSGGDAANHQLDMRARVFRERNPAAYGILTDPNPPVLKKVPATTTIKQAVRIMDEMLTTGAERFDKAEALYRQGKNTKAATIYKRLRAELPGSWIARAAQKRLASIREARHSQKNTE